MTCDKFCQTTPRAGGLQVVAELAALREAQALLEAEHADTKSRLKDLQLGLVTSEADSSAAAARAGDLEQQLKDHQLR